MYNVVCISRQFAWQFYCLVFLLLGSFIAWQLDCMVPYCLMVILPQEIILFPNDLTVVLSLNSLNSIVPQKKNPLNERVLLQCRQRGSNPHSL